MADPSPLPSSWSAEAEEHASPSRRWVVIGAIAAVVLVALGVATYLRTRGLDPEERAWPAELDGRPFGLGEGDPPTDPAAVTAEPGAYLWKDFEGWHLWVVNGDDVSGVTGTITSDDGWARAALASPTSGSVTTSGDVVTFALAGDQPVVGIDIEPGFYATEVEVDLSTPDGPLPAELLVVGGEGADELPLVLTKSPTE